MFAFRWDAWVGESLGQEMVLVDARGMSIPSTCCILLRMGWIQVIYDCELCAQQAGQSQTVFHAMAQAPSIRRKVNR